MFCPECGKTIEEGVAFCPECGRRVGSELTEKPQVTFEGGLVPSPKLLEGEEVLGSFEAGFWDIGLIGVLLRHKERLVVTTNRLFQFSRRLTSANLKSLELSKVESIYVGSKFKIVQSFIGIIFLLAAIFVPRGLPWWGRLMAILIGAIILFTARKKVLEVSCGDRRNSVSLPLTRIKTEESKRFIDLISEAIRNIERK